MISTLTSLRDVTDVPKLQFPQYILISTLTSLRDVTIGIEEGIQGIRISTLTSLRDVTFIWRPGKEFSGISTLTSLRDVTVWNVVAFRRSSFLLSHLCEM